MPTFRQDLKLGTKVPLLKTDDYGDQTVTEEKIKDGSISTQKLAEGSVTESKLDSSIRQGIDDTKKNANEAADNANAAADRIQATIDAAKVAIEEANNMTTKAEEASAAATEATAEALDTANHPTKIGEDHYVYTWDKTTKAYTKTNIYTKGDAMTISKEFSSVAEMEAYSGEDIKVGDLVVINSNDTEDEDNAKLYMKGESGWNFIVDLSGFRGFTGKTPQITIGSVSTLPPGEEASASLSPEGTDSDGNPKYLLNLAIPKGDKLLFSDLTDSDIAVLQKPATDAIASCNAAASKANIAAADANTAADEANKTNENVKTVEASRVSAETARALAEEARVGTENARVSAETERQTCEDKRKEAESSRVLAENDRVTAETARANTEASRVVAENVRIASELDRNNAEVGRVNAESIRVASEQTRTDAEKVRATAENKRVLAENDRVTAESKRANAESSRELAENTRSDSESARILAENNRVAAENARADAETLRADAETSRANAEKLRVSEEDNRAKAEAGRVNVEKERVTNETDRVAAETARVKAESLRQTNTDEALEEIRQSIENADDTANHPTKVGSDNYIYIWDKTSKTYTKTSIYVKGDKGDKGDQGAQGIKGDMGEKGKSPIIKNKNWWLYDDDAGKYVDSGVSVSSDYVLTKESIEGQLTGNVTSHTHDQYALGTSLSTEVDRATAAEAALQSIIDIINGSSETEGSFRKAIADLIGGAPESLDTLKEIADKLASDDDLHKTINEAIAKKAEKATTLSGYGITNAYTKTEVDTIADGKLAKSAQAADSDKLDGVHLSEIFSGISNDTENNAVKMVIGGVTKALIVAYASKASQADSATNAASATKATNADNADTLDGKHLSELFTDLSNDETTNKLALTIGGIAKSIVVAYANKAGAVDWANVDGKPSTYTPSSHTHTKSQITDFPSSLPASDVKDWAKADTKPSYTWSEINEKPSMFAPSAHTHPASDITSGTLDVARGGTGKTNLLDACNDLINALSTGSATPVDQDYFVSQYAGGGTTTTTYHRRTMLELYNYIKGKLDSVYQPKGNYLTSHQDISGKADVADLNSHTTNKSNPHSVTKAQVGLGNVDNTSDENKPISTATQSALDLKANQTSLDSALTRISSLESGSATTIETTGSGNAITAISKSGTKITATKGATFLTEHQDISGKADVADLNAAVTRITTLEGNAATAVTVTGTGDVVTAISKDGNTITATKGATIPTKTSQLTNDSDFVTSEEAATKEWIEQQGYIKEDDLKETLVISLASNQSSDTSIMGAAITVKSGDSTLNTYTWDGNAITLKLSAGQAITVSCGSITNYKTPDAQSFTAVEGNSRNITMTYQTEIVKVTLASNQSSADDIKGATVTIKNGSTTLHTLTWQGTELSAKVAYGTSYTVSVSSVTGYKSPSAVTNTAAQASRSVSLTYQTEVVTVTVSASDGTSVSGQKITVNGTAYTYSSAFSVKVPFGTSYSVSADAKELYSTPATQTFTASQASRSVTMVYTYTPTGIYILDTDGALTTAANWNTANNSKAVGVAVLTDNCRFVIAPENALSSSVYWSSNASSLVSGVVTTTDRTVAIQDFAGQANTAAMLKDVSSTSYPAGACNAYTFKNGKTGYLMSCGDAQVLLDNKDAVTAALSKIGGTAMSSYYWTSTQYSSDVAWYLNWSDGLVNGGYKSNYGRYVRAVCALD